MNGVAENGSDFELEREGKKMADQQAMVEENGGKEAKLGLGKLLAWSLRGGSTGVALMIVVYLTVFCTDTLGVDAKIVGMLLLVSKFLDGITDIFAGYIIDKTNTKLGRGRPYELCIIGLWAATLGLFMCPEGMSMTMKCIWIFVMYALVNSVFMTFLNANGPTYMVRAFNNPSHYIALSTYGGLVPMIIVVVFNIVFPVLMGNLATSQSGWIRLVLIFAIPLTFLGLLRFIFIKETYNVDSETNDKLELKDVFTVLKTNPYIYIVAFTTLVFSAISNMGVNVYYFTNIVGNVGLMGALAAVQVIAMPMMVILPQVLKKTTVAKVISIGIIVTILGYIINFIAIDNFALLAIGAVLTGAGTVPISMLIGLLIIDCAEYNEYKGLRRLEGSLSAVNGFASKLGSGLGAGLLGILIGFAGYDGTLTIQPASAITMIRMLYSLIPAALYVIVFLGFRFYKLDKLMPEIKKTNEERRNSVC